MNHVYRVIFNTQLGLWQAVCECARGRGKSRSVATVLSVATLLGVAVLPGAWPQYRLGRLRERARSFLFFGTDTLARTPALNNKGLIAR